MKNPSDAAPESPKATLDALAKEEEDIREKTRILQKTLEPKIAAAEKTKKVAGEKIARLKAELERMKADYYQVLAKVEGEERQRLTAAAETIEDVRSGRVSLQDYYARGKRQEQLDAEVRTAADAKCLDLLRLVREKAKAVIEEEITFFYATAEVDYAMAAPALMWITGLKEFTARAEGMVNAILVQGMPLSRMKLETKKQERDQANDHGMAQGERWNSLDAVGLRELRLDPRIPEKYLPELSAAIAEIDGTDTTVDIIMNYRRRDKVFSVIMMAAPRRSVMEGIVK